MNNTKLLLITTLFLISIVSISVFSPLVHASILNNLVDGVKDLFNNDGDKNVKNKQFTVESNIALAPEGDENNNGEIDAGDIVQFTYTLTNTTEKEYSFATLKTNIDRKQLNFIHNVQGTSGITDDGKTITIPNLRLDPIQTLVVSFDARINYYQDSDKTIFTEPEFIDSEKNLVAKSQKKEIRAKKISPDKINSKVGSNQKRSQ